MLKYISIYIYQFKLDLFKVKQKKNLARYSDGEFQHDVIEQPIFMYYLIKALPCKYAIGEQIVLRHTCI